MVVREKNMFVKLLETLKYIENLEQYLHDINALKNGAKVEQ